MRVAARATGPHTVLGLQGAEGHDGHLTPLAGQAGIPPTPRLFHPPGRETMNPPQIRTSVRGLMMAWAQ